MRKILLLGVAGAVVVVLMLYKLGGAGGNGERLEFPVTAEEALSIVESNATAEEFISEYLQNESRRITRISLNYDVSTGKYVWRVELVERECGCKVGSVEGLNMLTAEVDPVTGEILSLRTQVGVTEEEVARSRCMEGCHSQGSSTNIVLQEEVK